LPAAAADATIHRFQEAFSWLRRPDLVSVAAVHGHAIGAGFQLALACDLRVLAEDATFTMAESRYGLVPDLGGTHPLVAAVGYPRALEICLTARQVDAAEALAIGLATIVVPRAALDGAVSDLVAALLSAAPEVATETKALLLGATGRGRDEQEAAERAAQLRRLRALASHLRG
jgi:enoyl-CoA hydratase/carnithine racemase